MLTANTAGRSRRSRFAGRWCALALLTLGSVAAVSRAQDPTTHNFSLESEFRFAMVGDTGYKEGNTTGTMSSYNIGTRDVLSYKAHEGFLIRFGLEFEHYTFYSDDSPALPNKLQEVNLVIGSDIQIGDAWILRLEVEPGFYGGGRDLRTRNFDIPITLGASYFVSSDLQLVAGLSIDQERNYPVLPGVGFRYKINQDWVADFILPSPRLEYNFSKSLLFYAGGEIQSNSYRMEPNFGTNHGDPRLNNAIADYDQIRVGLGASWKIRKEVTLELEAGFVPIQEFDFHRVDVKVRAVDVPPYGGVVLKAAF